MGFPKWFWSPDCGMIDQVFRLVVVLDAEVACVVHVIVGEDLLLHSAPFSHLGGKTLNNSVIVIQQYS